jgi:hypothetical protein
VEKFNVPEGPDGEPAEPTEEQVIEVEREQMATALKAFHNPKLRDAILAAKRSLDKLLMSRHPTNFSERVRRPGFGKGQVDADQLQEVH